MCDVRLPKVYRLKTSLLWLGIVSTIFFAVMDVTSVYAAAFNIDKSFPRPMTFAIVFGVFWTGFVLLGVVLILAAVRERLDVKLDRIHQQRIVGDTTIPYADVDSMIWSRWSRGGHVSITASGRRKIKIYLDNFKPRERSELIDILRTKVRDDRQQNWESFAKHSEYGDAASPLSVARHRAVIWCGAMILFGMVFTGLALRGGPERWVYHLVAIVNYMVAIWVFFSPPKTSQ